MLTMLTDNIDHWPLGLNSSEGKKGSDQRWKEWKTVPAGQKPYTTYMWYDTQKMGRTSIERDGLWLLAVI